MNGPQGKLYIVKIGEFHTGTRFGKKRLSTGSRPFKDSVVLGRVSGRFECLLPSTILLSRRLPFQCEHTRKTDNLTSLRIFTVCQHEWIFFFLNHSAELHSRRGWKNSRFLTHDTKSASIKFRNC